ncbi:MAG: Rad52/Rad22 family DNA repair protein [Trueperaceae bacterium]
MEAINWKTLLEQLSVPFDKEDIAWRAGATSKDRKRAQALPYAESRVYEDRLNDICPGDWSVVFKPWGESRIICELTIQGLTRSSTGEFDDGKKNAIAEGTVAEAQAFKRACSKFGLGRYLYEIPIEWVEYDDEKNRLADVPQLPEKFLPKKDVGSGKLGIGKASQHTANNPQSKNAVVQDKPNTGSQTLNPERAEAMTYELEKLGYPKRDQLRLAASVLEKPVRDLASLSETEALEVWSYAKRVNRSVAA